MSATVGIQSGNRVEAVIDLVALQHNVRRLVERIAPSEVMLAVKANAYGHGLVEIARAGIDAGATSLAVLEVSTGIALRGAGITVPMLAWLHDRETDFRSAIEADVELGISSGWQVTAIENSEADRPAVIHLKVDTGLSRNGATPEEWPSLIRAALTAQEAGHLRIRGAWSHLADASVEDDEAALALFREAVTEAEGLGANFEVLHLAASSAGWRMPEARFDFVRFGIAAYGISPFDDSSGAELGLLPVMSLRARTVEVNVGETRLVRVAAGFADGVPTIGIPHARVLLNGELRPVVKVEVDSTLVDPGTSQTRVGDAAIFFGSGALGEPTAEQWADWSKTIADEIVTGIGSRVPRVFLPGGPPAQ
jgi:alanine racemase